MEFFDKKEEVLEITLTQKGKDLFSKGKFKPYYYSFHDTDITYDAQFTEEQNDIIDRIKATPTLKQNTNTYFIKDKTNEIVHQHKLYSEIGSKTLLDQYRPAWEINFIQTPPFQYVGSRGNPTITGSYQIKLSSSLDEFNVNQEIIPQVDIQTLYGIRVSEADGEFYLVKDDPSIIEISEYNSFETYENEEYEIEAYFVKGQNNIEQLSFNPDLQNSVFKYINILFDKYADFREQLNIKDIYGELVNKDETNC